MVNKLSLKDEILLLLQKTSVSLPEDIVSRLKKALKEEKNTTSRNVIQTILKNIEQAKLKSKPICQDTGTPIFYVKCPPKYSQREIAKTIQECLNTATRKIPLRPNSVDVLRNKSRGNEAVIHFQEGDKLQIKLIMKGAGSENVSSIYKLPNREINANRDLDGVGKCILETVFKAQGKGCPPYIIGVGIGGSLEDVASLSKKQLLRKLDDKHRDKTLRAFEAKMLKKINQLGIGPLGLGGKTTALAVKVGISSRHPASFFVGVSMGCWCLRRRIYDQSKNAN